MVSSESEVLPSALGIPSDDVDDKQGGLGAVRDFKDDAEGDAEDLQLLSKGDDFESLFCSRASHPSNDNGWLDEDHYLQLDAPANSDVNGDLRERHTDLNKIQVNGAIRR